MRSSPGLATVFALALALATAAPALATEAQPSENSPQDRNGVGLFVSNMSGSGLTYSREFKSGFGFHLSAIGWGQGSSSFVNAGFALTKEFDRREWGRLYGLAAVGVGLGSFFGSGGLAGGNSLQADFAPGIGVEVGPFVAEVGYSVYTNPSGPGFVPAGGLGFNWWF